MAVAGSDVVTNGAMAGSFLSSHEESCFAICPFKGTARSPIQSSEPLFFVSRASGRGTRARSLSS